MHGTFLGIVALLLGVFISSPVTCTAEANKTARAAKSRTKATWRVAVCLTQSQTPLKIDLQKAWENARLESSKTELELSYVEARAPASADSLSYPLSLLNKFCTDIENGRTVLSLIIGGGSAARFLVTAAASLNMPTLWIPNTHKDFLRQGKQRRFETRLGTSAREMGAAAAVLMHKANWHAFTLLIDSTLLPVHYLLQSRVNLTPRTIIHLPTNEKTLRLRLRRIAEQGGSGNVLVLACDLGNARKIITMANKFDMLSGRFLWLWLDVKAELRASEPNLISSHVVHPRPAIVAPIENVALKSSEDKAQLYPESRPHLHSLPNLASDVHQLQDYWLKKEKSVRKREDKEFHFFDEDEEEMKLADRTVNSKNFMPVGMLALRPTSTKLAGGDTIMSKAVRELSLVLDDTIAEARPRLARFRDSQIKEYFVPECYASITARFLTNEARENVSKTVTKKLRRSMRQISKDRAEFHLLNLQGIVFPGNKTQLRWTKVGSVRGGKEVRLDTIIWPGGGIVPAYMGQGGERIGMPAYKIVTALAPPFTMSTNLQEGLCLRGIVCRIGSEIKCCYGYSMDLLTYISEELHFRFELYIAKDGFFGKRNGRNWNGIVGELVSGRAQIAFAPISVSTKRAEVIDFTVPFYFSGVSFLTAPKLRSDIPLLAFLQPFSTELWIAVFTSLNITAMAVAVYEWLSPFGLNPWGRQRSKNFSIASALWVMWGLLCGHLVAFKAPKSWPNKFLINVWGGFSVIFVASYTANIAALIAGLFFHSSINNYDHRSLLSQKVGAPRASIAEYYIQRGNPQLWSHMVRYSVSSVADGVERLRNGSLDILIADTPILDYYRATDNGCRLHKIGDQISDDTYAVALTKGHPLKESISKLIANYTSTGLLDILQNKWYGDLPCLRGGVETGIEHDHGGQPRPLGVASVAGVFCLLMLGVFLGTLILAGEHLFYKYTLPRLRHRPKTSIWRSRNVMFFSQKLYRFINCVELVSPHHAARELVHTVRQGQFTSLFQKSVKRKEHEQRRRRKSKAQFFEMIQEIRRVQQAEKKECALQEKEKERNRREREEKAKNRERSQSKSPLMPRSPKRSEKCRSSTNLTSSRLGLSPVNLETPMKPREFTLSNNNLMARSPLETVGRRLSHGDGGCSPPILGSNFGGSANLRTFTHARTESTATSGPVSIPTPKNNRSPTKRGQSFPVFATLRLPASNNNNNQQASKSPLLSPNNELTAVIGRRLSREWGSGILDITRSSEAIGPTSSFTLSQNTPNPTERLTRKKSQGELVTPKQPIRRARSHENKDPGKLMADLPSPRLMAQPVVGGKSVSERTKKQLESELKAILTARAHHFELHPP